MSIKLGGSRQKQTSTQTVNLPSWLDAEWRRLTQQAADFGGQGPTPYTGEMTAGLSDTQRAGIDAVRGLLGTGFGQIGQAAQTAGAVAGAQAPTVQARTVAGTDLAPYMNPFLGDVLSAAEGDINRQAIQANMRARSGAAAAGAYGSSRAAVLEAENERAAMDAVARTSSGLRAGAFDRATALAGQDADRATGADALNAQMLQSFLGLNLNAAGLMGQLGQTEQAMRLNEANALLGAGKLEQDTETARLQALYQEFLRQQADQKDRLNLQIGAFGANPYNNQFTQTGRSSGTSFGFSYGGR